MRDNKNFVMVKYGYTYITDNQSTYTNITGMLDENGMVKLDFYPPKTNDNMSYPLNIEVKYYSRYISSEINNRNNDLTITTKKMIINRLNI